MDQKSVVNLARTNRYLNKLCESEKFWRKITFDLITIIEKMKPCEDLIWKYRNVLRHFIIDFDESEDSDLARERNDEINLSLMKLLKCLPESLKIIQVPIYLLKNSELVTMDFNRFQSLEILNLLGSNGFKDSTFNYLSRELTFDFSFKISSRGENVCLSVFCLSMIKLK